MTSLPLPRLLEQKFGALTVVTDNALAQSTGVRVVFSGRDGGASEGLYAELNLGDHVGDDLEAVQANRRALLGAVDAEDVFLIVPKQVHGTHIVCVDSCDCAEIEHVRSDACEGADGIVVSVPKVAAMLCFADCVPVVLVSPTGRFAVVHAGWRGVEAGIVVKALRIMAQADVQEDVFSCEAEALASYNVYIGPYIHGECFETGADVHGRFVQRFGKDCALDASRIDLGRALAIDLERNGVSLSRVADVGVCTFCNSDRYFSYRASGGVCGRHAALAFRRND